MNRRQKILERKALREKDSMDSKEEEIDKMIMTE
jgi:hypothetical protein